MWSQCWVRVELGDSLSLLLRTNHLEDVGPTQPLVRSTKGLSRRQQEPGCNRGYQIRADALLTWASSGAPAGRTRSALLGDLLPGDEEDSA